MLRPTCALTFTLAGAMAKADCARAVKRSFSYVAPTKVVPGETSSIRLEVRMPSGAAWDDSQAWEETLRPWLAHKLDKISGVVRECNNPERPSYFGGTDFKTLEVASGGSTCTLALGPDGSLGEPDDALRRVREALSARPRQA